MSVNYKPVFLAYQLNQNLSRIWLPLPFRWNCRELKWEYKEEYRLAYLAIQSLANVSVLALAVWSIALVTLYPGIGSTTQLMSMYLMSIILLLVIGVDVIFMHGGKELLAVLNWCYQRQEWIAEQGNKRFRYYLIAATHGSVFGIVIVGALFMSGAVLMDQDPFYLPCKHLMGSQANNGLMKLSRLILCLYLPLIATICTRTVLIVATSSELFRLKFLQILTSRTPAQTCISFYNENAVAMKMLIDLEKKCTTIAFSALFFLNIILVNILILGFERNILPLVFLSAMMLTVTGTILNFLFRGGGLVFSLSKTILDKWEKESGRSYYRQERQVLFRLIKSLPIISFPAGDVGIVDKEIQVNYLDRLLGSVVDSLVARSTFLDG